MSKSFLSLMVAALLAAGCANLKEPATQALSNAQDSLAALGDDAAKYVPDGVQSVQAELATLKDDLAKGDYKAVIAGAPKVSSDISALKDAVAAKKAEAAAALAKATAAWSDMSAQLPKTLEAIESRIATLSKSHHLPKGIDKAAVDSAKSGLESLKSTWAEASAAFTAGNVQDAVAKAQSVKDKAAEIAQSLKITT